MSEQTTRRQFLTTSGALAAVAAIGARAHAAGGDQLRVGLVGAGGRGTGAAVDALTADPGTRLVALADAFADRAQGSADRLARHESVGPRVDLPPDRRFVGFDAYRQVTDLVDVVILATPPYFRPAQLTYAVAQGKHVFCEKPVATDSPGLRECLLACQQAEEKQLSIVSGLCWRYHPPKVETMQRVLDGAIGEVLAVETNYNSGGVWDPRATREQCGSEMEYQLRNWYYYTWLSGDHICEQAVHSIDKMGWALHDAPPIRCRAVGGRQVRTDPRYGNIYDHFAVVYEYPNNVRGYHTCRHWKGCPGGTTDTIIGSNGVCDVFGHRLLDHQGNTTWKYDGPDANMYKAEHEALFQAIRRNEPINNGEYMCSSTMLAIIGRQAAYTGQYVTWEQAMGSTQALGPATLEWGAAPAVEVAVPGVTKLG